MGAPVTINSPEPITNPLSSLLDSLVITNPLSAYLDYLAQTLMDMQKTQAQIAADLAFIKSLIQDAMITGITPVPGHVMPRP